MSTAIIAAMIFSRDLGSRDQASDVKPGQDRDRPARRDVGYVTGGVGMGLL